MNKLINGNISHQKLTNKDINLPNHARDRRRVKEKFYHVKLFLIYLYTCAIYKRNYHCRNTINMIVITSILTETVICSS